MLDSRCFPPTANPAKKLCRLYWGLIFYNLEIAHNTQRAGESVIETKYFLRNGTIGVWVFAAPPSIRPGYFAAVMERSCFYNLKSKPNIQPWQEIRATNQVLASKANYWLLSVRLSTANPAKKMRHRYGGGSGFNTLKPNPTSKYDRESFGFQHR